MRLLNAQNVEDLALGAAVLATGGGGDPYVGRLMACQAIREYGPVQLLTLDEIGDNDLIVPTAMMGAPTVMIEKLPQGDEILKAFHTLETYLGRPIQGTMSIEAGGLNSTLPIVVAAQLGMPLVDCDGMGRAFPEVQMVTHTLLGIGATPMVLADEKGNTVILNTIDNRWAETFARSITVEMGATALIAAYAATGQQLKKAAIPDTMTLCEEIGRTIRSERAQKQDVISAVQRITGGLRIFHGKVVDVDRITEGGFAKGSATLEGIEDDTGRMLTLDFQNENLVAKLDGEVVVSVPDLITVMDSDTGDPIMTEGLRYGCRVVVLGIPCSLKWRSPEGLALVGPRYFGYDIEYHPVESRFK